MLIPVSSWVDIIFLIEINGALKWYTRCGDSPNVVIASGSVVFEICLFWDIRIILLVLIAHDLVVITCEHNIFLVSVRTPLCWLECCGVINIDFFDLCDVREVAMVRQRVSLDSNFSLLSCGIG